MTASDTTGVAILSELLKQLAGAGTVRVADFAAEQGFARATTFMVSRRLREHGLVAADNERGQAPGPILLQLAWAAFGLPEFAGPAEAVMRWLLEQVDGRVSLFADGKVVFELGECRQRTGDDVIGLDQVIAVEGDGRPAALMLRLSPTLGGRTAFAQRCLARAALTLEGYLGEPAAPNEDARATQDRDGDRWQRLVDPTTQCGAEGAGEKDQP